MIYLLRLCKPELSHHLLLHVLLTMQSNKIGLHQIMYPRNCVFTYFNIVNYSIS